MSTASRASKVVEDDLKQPGAFLRFCKYFFIFWGVCVIAGAAVAVGLANAGMSNQDAFNSGLTIALIPFIPLAVVAFLIFISMM